VKRFTLATRKSPLALAQSELVAARLKEAFGAESTLLRLVTTGDKQTDWVLEKQGGKGLFTGELEAALRRGEADAAVHSAKDLPGEMADGLTIAGYLPRADPRDMLAIRPGVTSPRLIATGSPRRRLQLALLFPGASFSELRGNVDTRLRKIAAGAADATVLAAAGLARLGITSWPGLVFRPLAFTEMVPAVGQAAVAIQTRAENAADFHGAFAPATFAAVAIERALQAALGGGCHTAFGAHATPDALHIFHERCGRQVLPLTASDFVHPQHTAGWALRKLGLVDGGRGPL
jgi:hydroxymethylbilane synthase